MRGERFPHVFCGTSLQEHNCGATAALRCCTGILYRGVVVLRCCTAILYGDAVVMVLHCVVVLWCCTAVVYCVAVLRPCICGQSYARRCAKNMKTLKTYTAGYGRPCTFSESSCSWRTRNPRVLASPGENPRGMGRVDADFDCANQALPESGRDQSGPCCLLNGPSWCC